MEALSTICSSPVDNLPRALERLGPAVRLLAHVDHADPAALALAMADACAQVSGSASAGGVRRSLLAPLRLVGADSGLILRDAGHR